MPYLLYVVEGSRDSSLARDMLQSKGVDFKVIDARKNGVLGFLTKDLGAYSIPALFTPTHKTYSGLREITGLLAGI